MSELTDLQNEYQKTRSQTADQQLELQRARAELDKLTADAERELKGLGRDKREQRRVFYTTEKEKLSKTIDELIASRKRSHTEFDDLTAGFFRELDPVVRTAELNDAFPILLFPLRLETRFKSTGDTRQLWLRVYPDDCSITTKEDLLSESELNNARSFWIEIWKAGGVEAAERGAWRSFVNSHGSGRCAWILQEFKPTNSKPTNGADKKILVVTSTLVLTADEAKAAQAYWAAVWLAKGNASLITAALNKLKTDTSDAKADEITRNYVPVNLADAVPDGTVADKVSLEKLELPAYTPKQSSWTQAAKANLLPDKFVAIGINGENKKTILFPRAVKDQLSVSLDPSLTGDDQVKSDGKGNLVLNEDVKWMADFEKAVEVGMAVKIDLSPQEAAGGFDKLFVVGIRFKTSPDESRKQLEQLFTDHFYSQHGFGLLKQGTPTNNTEDSPAGYSWTDDPNSSYENIFLHREDFSLTTELDKKSDGQKLADYLGIDPAVLKNVPNANGKDQLSANAMNTALFPATLGYFMDEMMDPLFSERDIEETRQFFSNFVSGRGPVPAIRIGSQPYGILPITVYSKLDFGDGDSIDNNERFYPSKLQSVLKKLDTTWDNLVSQVAFIGKAGDPHQILLDVVGLHSNSVEFHQRYSQSIQQLYNQLALQLGPFFAGLIAAAIAERARLLMQDLGIKVGSEIPIFKKFFLSNPNPLRGPLVDDVPDSEINAIRAYSAQPDNLNYIQWLAASTPEKIRVEDFGGNAPPTALLYLLLRHSLMLAQAGAATSMLASNQLINDKKIFRDPDFLFIQEQETGKSKFEHLYSPSPTITGSSTLKLIDHIYKPEVLTVSSDTRRLNDTINALKVLENMPTAALERLLTEHIDCCNYRLDAWTTGLVNFRLTQQRTLGQDRNQFSRGIYLGAYGWLLEVRPVNKVLSDVELSRELTEIFNEGNSRPLQTDSTNLGYIHAPSLDQAATAAILRNAYDSNRDAGSGNPFAINLTSDRVRIAENFLEGMRNGQSLSALLGYQFERGLHDKHSLGQGEVDMFIYPLRKRFPLVADNLVTTKTDASVSIEAIEANNVIDGVKLINHVQDSPVKSYPYDLTGLPAANPGQTTAIDDEVKRITDIHDAIGDLVMSEQVYQVVKGNFERASGNAEAFSKGTYPPDVEIKNTPRSGVTLTHRMAIQFDADADRAASPNLVPAMTARAKAEPSINKWLSDHLPAPEKVLCKVTYSSPVQAATEIEVSQVNLGLQTIDLLYVFSLETDQAMTALDDRIRQYVRYSVSHHPRTDIFIDYTKPIDAADRTKISFFELSALVKSLRKVINGSKYLTPASLTVPQEGGTKVSTLDDAKLQIRLTDSKNDLEALGTGIETILTNTKSISSLSSDFKAQLEVPITDASKVESILTQLRQDLKNYLMDPVAATKDPILTAFSDSISSIADAGVRAALRTAYSNLLDTYVADFANLDQLAADTVTAFMNIALFDQNQTGTGFIHEGIAAPYSSVFSKLDELVERWDKKKSDAEGLLLQYPALTTDEERVELLKNVEKIISSTLTLPVPPVVDDYKTAVDTQKGQFDALLNNLKDLYTNPRQKITDFITDAEALLSNLSTFDVMPFDVDRNKNDLGAEKLSLALLKEDIVTALSNLKDAIAKKISDFNASVSTANATAVNADKITALLSSAKAIFGDDALVLPQFTLDPTHGTELENSFTARNSILDFVKANENRIFPVDDWLGGIARVRDRVHEWENICFLTSAFKAGGDLDLAPIQLPFKENDRWFAMKFRDETDTNDKFAVNTDTLLYTVHFAAGFDRTKAQCGVTIDEWTEVIPTTVETTGITFHYDQPNSEPPQTMLLVTPPRISGAWNWNDIVESMEETLEMAKKRAVEPLQIEGTAYAQILPAIVMAVTSYWITVATNLSINNLVAQRAGNS